jgi:oxygen-dependent protoporphyrinogen oxidase
VVIVGGGITGLATAYRLLKAEGGASIEVSVLEGRAELGGNIRTERVDGLVIDGGPDAFVITKPHATALCRELGLGDRLLGTTAENRKVYILHAGKLHALPEGMVLTVPSRIMPMARTRLLSWRAKARMALDLVLPKRSDGADESIGEFMRRRLGSEITERIAEPLLGGIFAGDVEALSARSTFPQLVELEERHGSLIKGVLAQRKARAAAMSSAAGSSEKSEKKAAAPSAFYSLIGGMGELIETLAAEVTRRGGVLRTSTRIDRITSGQAEGEPGSRFIIKGRGPTGEPTSIEADDLVIALPAYAAAHVLRDVDAELASILRSIPYESTATIFLGYRRSEVPHPLDATGLIIPKTERRRALAATFVTSKWEHRAPKDVALFRVFAGGHRDPSALEQSDDALIRLARDELAALVGVKAEPFFIRVFRHERASAQPNVGHADRMRRARERAAAHPGLHLAGAAFEGVGIPDCVRQAGEVASRILERPSGPPQR